MLFGEALSLLVLEQFSVQVFDEATGVEKHLRDHGAARNCDQRFGVVMNLATASLLRSGRVNAIRDGALGVDGVDGVDAVWMARTLSTDLALADTFTARPWLDASSSL